MKPNFKAGDNIAVKVPSHHYEQTVAFYRDILGLETVDVPLSDQIESVTFKFGDKNLWVDKVPNLSQSEIWLEIQTDDLEQAAEHFRRHGIVRRDEIEPLPDDFKGFWIAAPGDIIHLVNE